MAGVPLFEARNIVKKFGDFAANDDVALMIQPGEKHALLGENGAGKSTLVKMMYGVMQPTSGAFYWNGQQTVVHKPAEARDLGIGMVFQHFSVFDALTVVENIALALPPEPMRALAQRIETHREDDLPAAVRRAASLAEAGDVVLLAPACASQDQFRDYAERGDRFRETVAELAGEAR